MGDSEHRGGKGKLGSHHHMWKWPGVLQRSRAGWRHLLRPQAACGKASASASARRPSQLGCRAWHGELPLPPPLFSPSEFLMSLTVSTDKPAHGPAGPPRSVFAASESGVGGPDAESGKTSPFSNSLLRFPA